MKSIVLSSVVTALLMFSGCSDKQPQVETQTNDYQEEVVIQEVEEVSTEVVATEDSMVEVSSNTMSMSDIESELSAVYFAFDKYSLNADMQNKVSTASEIAKADASAYNVKLEGNCDEWGSDEYNFALGLKRAESVKKALIAEGVDRNRISMVSYGESNPACTEKTQECWSKNRRVDFKLLP